MTKRTRSHLSSRILFFSVYKTAPPLSHFCATAVAQVSSNLIGQLGIEGKKTKQTKPKTFFCFVVLRLISVNISIRIYSFNSRCPIRSELRPCNVQTWYPHLWIIPMRDKTALTGGFPYPQPYSQWIDTTRRRLKWPICNLTAFTTRFSTPMDIWTLVELSSTN